MHKKRGIFICVSILFFLSIFIVKSDSPKINMPEEILEKLNSGKEVRVIIEFNEEILKEGGNFKTNSNEKNLDIKIKHNFESKVSAIINSKDLQKLEDNPRIKSIKEVGIKQILLQNSVPLINATFSWPIQMNTLNITGKGETICIIDTGVDYTHPDLGGCYGNNNLSSECKVWGGYDYCADDVNCNTVDEDPIDVHSHGTHVAGIVSANGSIKGVAPDSRIIVIKAGNSTGAFWDDDLEKAIDWCVNNASKFNISVISMSLGGGFYSSYCNNDYLANSINDAITQNISVVIATGNDGEYEYIASPACIENATAVSSSTKVDLISSFSNRNNLTDLFAPGSSINSTYLTESYSIKSGTSMSTPHVAGAFALIRQFYRLQSNIILTPAEIENVLKNTGKIIYDSSSDLNFSRINIYSAIASLDNKSPEVTLVSPEDSSLFSNQNQSFICNVTDEIQISKITFYLWNSSGEIINQTDKNLSGTFSLQEFNITNLSSGEYFWNCLAYDSQNNSAFSNSNFSLTIGEMRVNLNLPVNTKITNKNQSFNCSAEGGTDLELSNLTFYLWNSTNNLIYNLTKNISGNLNSSLFYYNFTEEGEFKWNCLVSNNNSGEKFANLNYTLTYDVTLPNINLISPYDEDSSKIGTSTINFQYNISETNIANCSLIINGVIDQTNSSINISEINYFSKSLSPGNYIWRINCSDLAGNIENSSSRTLTINAESVVSGGGGGGSRNTLTTITGKTYELTNNQIQEGYSQKIKTNEKIKFTIRNERHTLTIKNITGNQVLIEVASNPVTFNLGVNETKKLDLNNDKIYDLEVKFLSVEGNYVNISVKEIEENIPVKYIFEEDRKQEEFVEESPETISNEIFKKYVYLVMFIIIAIISIIVINRIVYQIIKILSKL